MCVHSSQVAITSNVRFLVSTEFTANALRVTLSPLVKFTLSWLTPASAQNRELYSLSLTFQPIVKEAYILCYVSC